MDPILILSILFGFFTTLFFIPFWIRKAKQIGLTGKNKHQRTEEHIVEAGGISILFGFVLGVLSYIAIKTFYYNNLKNLIEIFALLSSIILIGFVGFLDDILGWKKGLSRRSRIILVLFSAIPLMVINAGESSVLGINFGYIYPLILIPIGILGATTTYNFLAGYNGLESSQGILILSGLAFVTYKNGESWLSLIIIIMIFCLVAFYLFNKYPAKIFPGDILTYTVGALIAITAILGNIEKIALFFFIPYILETILKIRGQLKKESFAGVNQNGGLEVPYEKFYGLEHISIYLLKKIRKRKEVREKDVVYLINLFQIVIIVAGLLLFKWKII